MTRQASSSMRAGLLAIVSCIAAACGGGGSSDPQPTQTPGPSVSPTIHSTAVPTATPTLFQTPESTPTTGTSSAVSGVLVLQRSVTSNAGDALAAAPEGFGPPADKASFDRALSHADWFVSGTTDKRGVTTSDGRFEVTGLAAGRYGLQVNRTLDGNLVAIVVPFTVGDNGGAEVVAEVSLGQVKSISTYTKDGAPVREVVAPNGTLAVVRDGRVIELSDGNRTLTDSDGDGRFDSSACPNSIFSCDAGGRCGDTLSPCHCTSSCPSCDDCKLPGVCLPPNGTTPYSCSPDRTCTLPGDHCVCVPSCPGCEDCPATVCVPGCDPIEIQSIQISGSSQLVVGQPSTVNASAILSDGTAIDVTYLVDWRSSDESIATVDSWGLLSALSVGSTNLTATLGSLTSDPWPVAVVARPPLRKIYLQNTSCVFPLGAPGHGNATSAPEISPPAPTDILPVPSCTQVVQIGGTIQFRALGEFDNGYYQDVTDEVQWLLTPLAIGTIDKGLFTGTQPGSATLTAMLAGVSSDGTNVKVVTEPSIVAISIYADNAGPPIIFAQPADNRAQPCFDCGYNVRVLRGDTLRFHATAQYDTGGWKDVTELVAWHSSDATVASVDAHGVMMAAEAGGADITATLSDITSGTVNVQIVSEATLQSIYVAPQGGDQVVAKGDQRFFRATGFYDVGGLNRDVTAQATWHSSDEQIGGFDVPGVFTGRSGGTVQVWAELDGLKSNSLSLQVFETSELNYCDPSHINRGVWSDDFNRVVLESDCADYKQPSVATLRYTVTETQPHGGVFKPCLDLYVYQGNTRVRAIREEGCGDPFLPSAAPGRDEEVLKYQLRAFWDLKDDSGKPVSPGAYKIYGRFYLYYDPVVSIDVTVLQSDGTAPKLPDLVPTDVHLGACGVVDCAPRQMMDVCVGNHGDADAGPFLVSVPPRTPIKFTGLAAGGEQCVAMPFMPSGVVGVDVNNSVIESDEGNNKIQFNLPAPVATACDFVPGCSTPSATPTPKPTSHGPVPRTPTPTPTPPPLCTPVRCDAGGVLACLSGHCPGGCGYQCVTPTPTAVKSCCKPGEPCAVTIPPCAPCGGISGAGCPAGYQCIDDPTDECAPPTGADCGGICVPIEPGQCTRDSDCPQPGACTLCADGSVSCPQSICDQGICRVTFSGCLTPTPTPGPIEGECFRGAACEGSSFATSHSACCDLSRVSASALPFSWCPADQLDPSNGKCLACVHPCDGLPSPTPTPSKPCCAPGDVCIPELPPCPPTCCPFGALCTANIPSCIPCGGIGGIVCPNGYQCVDDPTDECAPPNGADCPGICSPTQPGQCAADSDCPQIGAPCTICADGTVSCPESRCDQGVCHFTFNGCAGSTPTPTPSGLGACFRGAMCDGGSSFPTSQNQCCILSRLSASLVKISWCPPNQLDPSTGKCLACAADPCEGLPTPTPTPAVYCTPPLCGVDEVYSCSGPDDCPGGCGTICVPITELPVPTPTPTPAPTCTKPQCEAGQVLVCVNNCPGGCGVVCATPLPGTPTPTAAIHRTSTSTPLP